jgi:hypothetical protein
MILWKAGKSPILLGDVSRLPELNQTKLEFADAQIAAELRNIPQQPEADQTRLDVLFHVYLLLLPSFERLGPSC